MENYKKTFLKIFAGQTISLLTSSIVQFAIIWYLTFKTNSAMVLAISTIAGILPQIILGPFAGVLIDRLDRKKVMIASDLLVAVSTLVLAFLFMVGDPSVIAIYIILAIRSLGATFHYPSFQASIPLLAPEDKIVKISGINQTITSITTILAPIVAGILFGIVKTEYLILLDIIGAIFGIGSLLLVKIPNPVRETVKVKVLHEMKEGFLEIKKSKFIFSLTMFCVIFSIIYMPSASLFPLMTSSYFKLTPLHVSIVEVAFSVGMLVGGILLATWGGLKKKQYTIILAMLLFGVALLFSGLTSPSGFVIFVILTAVMGLTAPFMSGVFIAILQLEIDTEKMGRVFSIVNSMLLIATPVGLILTAPIAEKIGINILMLVSGILLVLISIIAINVKSIRNENV